MKLIIIAAILALASPASAETVLDTLYGTGVDLNRPSTWYTPDPPPAAPSVITGTIGGQDLYLRGDNYGNYFGTLGRQQVQCNDIHGQVFCH